MKIKNLNQGFIQIPILIIALIVAGSFASVSSNYLSKHKQNDTGKPEIKTELKLGDYTATTSTVSQKQQPKTTIRAKTSGFIPDQDIKPTEVSNDFTKLIIEAKEHVKLLEQDKLNFQLLNDTVDEHKQKSINHAVEMMSSWVNFAESSISKVPSEYQQSIRLTRDSIISDQEYVVQTIKSYYATINFYFSDVSLNKKHIDVIISLQNELSNCIKLWNSETKNLSCQFSLDFIPTIREEYVKDFRNIPEKLVRVDDYTLEMISTHTKMAEDNITSDLESIFRIVGIMTNLQADLARIGQSAQQNIIQPVFNTSVKCYTSTNDSIFNQNRTYSTRCEPYVRTTAQRCATAQATRLAYGVYDSQSNPECK